VQVLEEESKKSEERKEESHYKSVAMQSVEVRDEKEKK